MKTCPISRKLDLIEPIRRRLKFKTLKSNSSLHLPRRSTRVPKICEGDLNQNALGQVGAQSKNDVSKEECKNREFVGDTEISHASTKKLSSNFTKTNSTDVDMRRVRDEEKICTKEGYAVKYTDMTAQVFKEERVSTAVCCPCKNEDCSKVLRVERFAMLGKGSWKCVHYDHLPTEMNQYGVRYAFAFSTIAHLRRHLATSACRRSQVLSRILTPPRKCLSDAVAYEVDNPLYKMQDEDGRETFKCPICSGTLTYRNRYNHVVQCYPKHKKQLK